VSRLFGTDGVRGVANAELTPELAFRVARAAAAVLTQGSEHRRPVVIGRDTRRSGSMLEAAMVAGFTSVGRDVWLLGIIPTPGVACVTRCQGAVAGVMISASHNPIEDNGIKFFGPDGFKLPDHVEDAIERAIDAPDLPRPAGADVGAARMRANLGRAYYRQLCACGVDLSGIHVVVDAAFGAAYAVAPYVLRKLGATVTEMHCEPDGTRINVECGATDLRPLQEAIRSLVGAGERRAIGVAFDGDADRVLFVDETGAVVSGDHVMFALACDLHARAELAGDTVVATVMSNIGLERALRNRGIRLMRTGVGDRNVLEAMRCGGYVLGGEQSGHVIDLRRNTTGDGPMTAVALLGIVAATGKRLHDLVREVAVAPQVLRNVRTSRKDVLERPAVREAIERERRALDGSGRVLIRPSGTEPLIRVMVEGDDLERVEGVAAKIASRIEEEIGRLT
jgi:phosphoglucosamine mutase